MVIVTMVIVETNRPAHEVLTIARMILGSDPVVTQGGAYGLGCSFTIDSIDDALLGLLQEALLADRHRVFVTMNVPSESA